MGYRLEPDESLTDSVRRVAREQIDKALASAESDDIHEAVHELRKRCKKIRGLVRLVRPGFDDYAPANKRFRDIARILSHARDRAAALETHRALMKRYRAGADLAELGAIGSELERRRDEYERTAELPERLERASSELRAARDEVDDWSIDDDDSVVGAGIAKTYRRARRAMTAALDDAAMEILHEWRKRTKYNRYHMRLLRSAWPAVFTALHDEARRLSDYLGDDHDLALLRADLLGNPDEFGGHDVVRTYVALVDGRRRRLQDDSFSLGERLYGTPTKRMRERIELVLEEWRG